MNWFENFLYNIDLQVIYKEEFKFNMINDAPKNWEKQIYRMDYWN